MRTSYRLTCLVIASLLLGLARAAAPASPLTIGETFTIESKVLNETRRINVYVPPGYAAANDMRVPVLYMPDGGIGEDFLHIAGLLQVSIANESMRPFMLVGIENTARRRDLTGPTQNAEDKKIAPQVGGSMAFREFIRKELMPEVEARYRTTEATAIIGESLAGLFVVETFLLDRDLFDIYIAVDPSVWWNDARLVNGAADHLRRPANSTKTLYFVSSEEKEIATILERFAASLAANAAAARWHYEHMPQEKHSAIFHPAALKAFRTVLAKEPGKE